jgi:thiosulfate reductase / polysulfide reductase chain A
MMVHPTTAQRFGVKTGEVVWVESPYGRVKAIVRVTSRIHPEVVGVQHGFGHTALGRLAAGRGTSDSALRPTLSDPLSGQALHKEACVRLVKA